MATKTAARKRNALKQKRKTPNEKPPSLRLTRTFLEEYAKLNTAQKQAVDTIEGPVLVCAGPGTGKTQVVALRVANVLRKTQMRPSNILCLTFSLSGAKAMRERLRSLIGPDAYGVTVATVHSFCNDLILSHPHIFEEFRALEQVSAVEQLRILRACMRTLGVGSILGVPSRENDRASAVLSRISEMKREGIAPLDLRNLAPQYLSEIQTTQSGKERGKATKAYQDDLRRSQQFEEFILLHEGYNAALRESHRYDYEDMILVAHEALKKHDALLASLQERYQYFLVDEFQDLNGAQHHIIEVLTTYAGIDQPPNLFAVGDDDQAIYRFQGASPKNMLQFLDRFPEAPVITLTENYRSVQPILDAATALIEKNEERLVGKIAGIEKSLQSRIKNQELRIKNFPHSKFLILHSHRPVFLRFPSPETEYAGIAQLLREEHERGIPWNEMAVLCRRNEEVQDLADVLAAAGIPATVTGKRDLLLLDVILQTIAILRAIEHPENDVILSAALGCETFHCHPTELARAWIELQKSKRGKEPAERASLRTFLLNSFQPSLLTSRGEELRPASQPSLLPPESPLHRAYLLIEDLHSRRGSITLPSLLARLLKESGFLAGKEATVVDPRTMTALHAFYEYVKRRVYEQKSLTLSDLLSDLDHYVQEPTLHLMYDMPHLTLDGVQLMTAHGAKGLEFACVLVPHLRFRNWGGRHGGNLLALPDHLIFGIPASVEKRAAEEDERRLLYVAVTRAKSRLILTFSETIPLGEEVRDAEVSSLIADFGDIIEEVRMAKDDVPALVETLRTPPLKLDDAFRSFLSERLESFHLSVTALNAFLDDPQAFLYLQLLEQPQAKAPHLAFGSAVHAALEKRNLALQSGDVFTVPDFLRAFERSLTEREILTETERQHYLGTGRLILERYGKAVEGERPIILSAERALTARLPVSTTYHLIPTTSQSDIPLFGIVDRIDLFHKNGKNCRIVDYKTGKPYRTAEAVRKEGRLWRQLVFYKLLCDLSPHFIHTVTHCTLDFVGTEREGRSLLEFEITERETKELQELIKAVWSKIIALDFTPL